MVKNDADGVGTGRVSPSHYTGYQRSETRRVPLSGLKPRELVLLDGSGQTSLYVGLYVGNDIGNDIMMVDSPHAGELVRYENIYALGGDLLAEGARP